jgi:hypothetical protein
MGCGLRAVSASCPGYSTACPGYGTAVTALCTGLAQRSRGDPPSGPAGPGRRVWLA